MWTTQTLDIPDHKILFRRWVAQAPSFSQAVASTRAIFSRGWSRRDDVPSRKPGLRPSRPAQLMWDVSGYLHAWVPLLGVETQCSRSAGAPRLSGLCQELAHVRRCCQHENNASGELRRSRPWTISCDVSSCDASWVETLYSVVLHFTML